MTRKMTYHMPLKAADGRVYLLEGFKTIHDSPGPPSGPTRPRSSPRSVKGTTRKARSSARGSSRSTSATFSANWPRREIVGARRIPWKNSVAWRSSAASSPVRSPRFTAESVARSNPSIPMRRPANVGRFAPGPRDSLLPDERRRQLKLTRFKGGPKGPVILSPGFGTSALAYHDRHDRDEPAGVSSSSMATTTGSRLPREPRPPVGAHAVHARRHRDEGLPGGRENGARGDRRRHGPGDGALRRLADVADVARGRVEERAFGRLVGSSRCTRRAAAQR